MLYAPRSKLMLVGSDEFRRWNYFTMYPRGEKALRRIATAVTEERHEAGEHLFEKHTKLHLSPGAARPHIRQHTL